MKQQILDEHTIDTKLNRIAYEIVENNMEVSELVLAGIIDRGVVIAQLLKEKIERIASCTLTLVSISIDKLNPVDCTIEEGFDPHGKHIIVVDDVADSGKTLMYALKPFMHALPATVQVAVLVDRKHKRYPVTPDYVGLQLSTTLQDNIRVVVDGARVSGAFVV